MGVRGSVGVRGGVCEGWCEVLRGTGWHSEC